MHVELGQLKHTALPFCHAVILVLSAVLGELLPTCLLPPPLPPSPQPHPCSLSPSPTCLDLGFSSPPTSTTAPPRPHPSSTSQKTFRRFPTKSDTTGMAACAGWILTVASVLSLVTHVLHVFFPSLLNSPWASITTLPRPSGAAANRSGVHDNDPTVSAGVGDTESCVVQGEVV